MGTVIKKIRSDDVERDGVQLIFNVRRVWKGEVGQKAIVYTSATIDLYQFENK
jgi:hypothetical protein